MQQLRPILSHKSQKRGLVIAKGTLVIGDLKKVLYDIMYTSLFHKAGGLQQETIENMQMSIEEINDELKEYLAHQHKDIL